MSLFHLLSAASDRRNASRRRRNTSIGRDVEGLERRDLFAADLGLGSLAASIPFIGPTQVQASTQASAGVSVAYKTDSDWGTGFNGEITVTNNTTTAINGWKVGFDLPASITTLWDANIMSHVGNHYTVGNAGYNATIAPGQSVSFGFGGARNGSAADPSNYTVNGTAVAAPVTPPVTGTLDLSATYKVTSDWQIGFTGSVSFKNTGTLAVSGWTFAFDLDAQISSMSGAMVISHVGNHYVVKDSGWDASLPVGQATGFDFVASRGNGNPGPAIDVMSNVVFTAGTQKKSISAIGPNG